MANQEQFYNYNEGSEAPSAIENSSSTTNRWVKNSEGKWVRSSTEDLGVGVQALVAENHFSNSLKI